MMSLMVRQIGPNLTGNTRGADLSLFLVDDSISSLRLNGYSFMIWVSSFAL